MKNISLSISISLLLTACGGGSSIHQGELATIDVETALQNPQELSLTDLGEKFTYVPLETTDESLVKLESQSGGIHPGCGIYNFHTGELKVQKEGLSFKHPDEGMPDTCVYTLSTDGSWVAIYQAYMLVEARENIPAEKQPEWLKNLKEDDNPVLLIIK